MRTAIALLFVVLLAPLWIPFVGMRMAWRLSNGMSDSIIEWLEEGDW